MSSDVEAPKLDHLTSLIRIIRERQQLYFSLLAFINKNIQSSSDKLDQIGPFNQFLSQIKTQQTNLKRQEETLYSKYWINREQPYQNFHQRKNNKQISRLTLRLIEMLQISLQKSANTVFNNSGRLSSQFIRFKKLVHRITTAENINIKTFVITLVNYAVNKFNLQMFTIQKYLIKLESGEQISLRDMYRKDGTDISCPEQKSKQMVVASTHSKQRQSVGQANNCRGQKPHPSKSFKKTGSNRLSALKKKLSKKQTSRQQKQQQPNVKDKCKTAFKLFKFYHLLELNKKQFMEDYIFQEDKKSAMKQSLLISLLQRNRSVKHQINSYVERSEDCLRAIAATSELRMNLNKANQEQQMQTSIAKIQLFSGHKVSLGKSFVISKKKWSLNFENSPSSGNSDSQVGSPFFSRTVKTFTPSGKVTNSTAKSHNKTNRIYIAKTPVLFEGKTAPRNLVSNPVRKDHSSALKGKQKRNQSMRMRRRNNPVPLEKNSFLQAFRYESSLK